MRMFNNTLTTMDMTDSCRDASGMHAKRLHGKAVAGE